MRRRRNAFRPALAAVVIATVLAMTGGHWQILQSVAWARMLVDFSRTLSLQTAIEYTFDGEHPCAMCKMIEKAKQASNRQELQQVRVQRDDLFADAFVSLVPHKEWSRVVATVDSVYPSRTDPPPVPPPRPLPRRS